MGPVLIIGGGLGGLSLAQGLKQHGIPFKVFERDHDVDFHAQGYRIRITQQDALQKLLPPHLYTIFEQASATVISGGHTYMAVSGEESIGRGPPQAGPAFNADRTVLRNILLRSLENDIEFGKKLDRYDFEDADVIATFADGTQVRGSMIVGADGARSQVRKQLIPAHHLLDTEGRAIFGKTPIGSGIPPEITESIDKGITLIKDDTSGQAQTTLFCDIMKFDRTRKIDVELPEDYVYWVLVFQKGRTDITDQKLLSLAHDQSAQLTETLTTAWQERFRSIITKQNSEATSTLAFLMLPPLDTQAWAPDARITLLGDAAHPMPPVGGVGANIAFQDAADLLDFLVQDSQDAARVGEYDAKVRDRASKALIQSAGGAGRFFGMKPVTELKPWTL